METIYVKNWGEIPCKYTGCVIYQHIHPNSNTVEWYKNGFLHREDGPAFQNEYHKVWWQNGQKHRIDGPAIEYNSGHKAWFFKGKSYSAEDHFDIAFFNASPSQQEWMLFNLDIWRS